MIIPFIDENPLFSERSLHYDKFKITSLLLNKERPLTLDSKLKIVKLAYDMNKKGKRRLYSKYEYIKLLQELHK